MVNGSLEVTETGVATEGRVRSATGTQTGSPGWRESGSMGNSNRPAPSRVPYSPHGPVSLWSMPTFP